MQENNEKRKLKLGLMQVDHIVSESIEEKQDRLFSLTEECLKKGAELVFFPEGYQYSNEKDIFDRPQELARISEKWKERLSKLAVKYNAYIVPWEYEVGENGAIYNSSYILDRNGNEVGRYRKCHLTYGEQLKLTAGNEFKVFDLDFGKLGIMICFDNYFPESARCLGVLGAELVLYPLYGDTLNPQWETKLRARAIDNGMYIATAQIDMHAMQKGISYSGLVNPEGNVICRLTEKDSCCVVEIDLAKQVITNLNAGLDTRENLKYMLERSRNVEAYKPICEPKKNVKPWNEICNYSKE